MGLIHGKLLFIAEQDIDSFLEMKLQDGDSNVVGENVAHTGEVKWLVAVALPCVCANSEHSQFSVFYFLNVILSVFSLLWPGSFSEQPC